MKINRFIGLALFAFAALVAVAFDASAAALIHHFNGNGFAIAGTLFAMAVPAFKLEDVPQLATEMTERIDELKSIIVDFKAKYGDSAGLKFRLDDLEQRLVSVRAGRAQPYGSEQASIRGECRKLFESAEFKRLRNGSRGTATATLDFSIKALTSLQGSTADPAVGVDVQAERMGFVLPPQRSLRLLEVLPSIPVKSNSVEAPVFGAGTLNNAGYQEGEGALKRQGEIVPDLEKFTIATIAEHTTVSKQLLDDEPIFLSIVDTLLTRDVTQKTERELLVGDGAQHHIKGMLEYNAPVGSTVALKPADRIGEAVALMESAGFMPSLVVVNPLDWQKIASERATDGQYVTGGWAQPARPTVWRSNLVSSASVPQNTALVIDTQYVTILDRQEPTVEVSTEHSDNFTRNLVTIRCEARVGLWVKNRLGMMEVTLS